VRGSARPSAVARCLVRLGVATLTALALVGGESSSPAGAGGKVTALIVARSGLALAVRGSDQRVHVDYDLLITNAFPEPVTVTSIEVLGPRGRVLLNLTGRPLGDATKALTGGARSATIPASAVVDTVIDVVLPKGGAAVKQLTHRIAYTLPPHPIGPIIQSELIRGPRVTVAPRPAVVIASPLSGSGWYDGNGCCLTDSDHRVGRLPVDGSSLKHPETFAIDWVREQGGRFFTGDGSKLSEHFAFGAVVRSATGGVVTATRDGRPEQIPFKNATGITENLDFPGNYVTIRVHRGVYAFYAHFQPGTVAVKVGDRVRVGQRLGLLGNTGNSGAPHLHFGLIDGPYWATADSLPFEINSFRLSGVSPGDPVDGIDPRGPSGPRRDSYPLMGAVTDFG
jgi:Peptidase family M23